MACDAGLIFDFDGVIVDSEKLQYRAYAAVLADLGVTVTRAEYGREWIAAGRGPEYAVESYRLEVTAEELRQRKNPVYHDMLRAEAELIGGVPAALTRLGAAFPLALATNSSRKDTDFVLDHFDIRRHFEAIVTREDYERRKPAPDAFLTAAKKIGRKPGDCVVIEDAYKGVLAAFRAGSPCIAIPHEFTRENDFRLAAAIVDSLAEVTDAFVESLLDLGRARAAESSR